MSLLWMGYLLGLAQGVRHAFEPDHITAVSTLVAEQRSARGSAFYAACWGLGHALMLLAVGGALFVLRRQLPAYVAQLFELAVAAMLVALGVRALRRSLDGRRQRPPDTHQPHPWTGAPRPLLIGVVHGLAGSGALTALVASSYPSAAGGLVFIAVYGLGARAGMARLAGRAGVPHARAMRSRRGPPLLLGVAGTVSLALGVVWAWKALYALAPEGTANRLPMNSTRNAVIRHSVPAEIHAGVYVVSCVRMRPAASAPTPAPT